MFCLPDDSPLATSWELTSALTSGTAEVEDTSVGTWEEAGKVAWSAGVGDSTAVGVHTAVGVRTASASAETFWISN